MERISGALLLRGEKDAMGGLFPTFGSAFQVVRPAK